MRSVPEGDMILHYVGAAGPYVKHPSHDRSAAIVGATIIEYALKKAICLHLKPDPNDPNFNYLFDSDEAPYREFAGRLRLAKALGILSQNDFDKLEAIRHIRNAFAHTLSPIDFDTPRWPICSLTLNHYRHIRQVKHSLQTECVSPTR
jgi:hypothetical protein